MYNLKPKIFMQKKISKKGRDYIEISVYLDDELVQKAIRKSRNNENVLKFLAFPKEGLDYFGILIPEKKDLLDNSDILEQIMEFKNENKQDGQKEESIDFNELLV